MGRNYEPREYLSRLVWWLLFPLFRYSPRHLYGWRNFLLKLMGAEIKSNVKIYPTCYITFPWKLRIGENVTVGWNVRIYNLGFITIGNNVVISQHAHLCAGTHDYNSKNFELIKSSIEIRNNVWIASDSFIGPDVIINENCVIGARAVVTKSTEGNAIYAGNPAKRIKGNVRK